MSQSSRGTVIVAVVTTFACSGFAVVAAVNSASGRPKPAAESAAPVVVESTSAVPGTAGAGVAEVSIAGFAFEPSALEAAAGSTVTWTNRDDVTHNIFTSDGILASPDLESGDIYTVTLDKPGTITYYCDIHQYMRGTIAVTP